MLRTDGRECCRIGMAHQRVLRPHGAPGGLGTTATPENQTLASLLIRLTGDHVSDAAP